MGGKKASKKCENRGQANYFHYFCTIDSNPPTMDATLSPLSAPLYVMAKPVGSHCNLACHYCYYLDKARLYADTTGAAAPRPHRRQLLMSDATLEAYIRQYIEAQTQAEVLFTWHGGEPLMRPIAFYEKVLRLQRRYGRGHVIDNCIQTNGTLLTDEWCRFLRRNNWLVGISIDGPAHLHDAYRRTAGGRPSFDRVMRGIDLLRRHGVEWNVMGVVNSINADHPLEVYRFWRDIGAEFIQFTPIVERDDPEATVAPGQYAHFVTALFDEWVRSDVGTVFVQLFDSILACWVGQAPGLCTMAPTCGHATVIEHNGDLYSCDHFVGPQHLLGNIHQTTIAAMAYSPRQQQFGLDKRDALPAQCLQCPWLSVCNGGCPKDRIALDSQGCPGLNYLCADYRAIFAHVAPAMDFMAGELAHERPPANVMQWLRRAARDSRHPDMDE